MAQKENLFTEPLFSSKIIGQLLGHEYVEQLVGATFYLDLPTHSVLSGNPTNIPRCCNRCTYWGH